MYELVNKSYINVAYYKRIDENVLVLYIVLQYNECTPNLLLMAEAKLRNFKHIL